MSHESESIPKPGGPLNVIRPMMMRSP